MDSMPMGGTQATTALQEAPLTSDSMKTTAIGNSSIATDTAQAEQLITGSALWLALVFHGWRA